MTLRPAKLTMALVSLAIQYYPPTEETYGFLMMNLRIKIPPPPKTKKSTTKAKPIITNTEIPLEESLAGIHSQASEESLLRHLSLKFLQKTLLTPLPVKPKAQESVSAENSSIRVDVTKADQR